jgi:hypothetical protein
MVTAVLKTLQADGLQTAAATNAGPERLASSITVVTGTWHAKQCKIIKFHSITHMLGINIRAKLSFSSVITDS